MVSAADRFWSGEPEAEADALEPWEETIVDDPDALERAELAVRGEPVVVVGPPDADSTWIPVASGPPGLAGVGGINDVALALEGDGVPIGWDPYDPREAIGVFPGVERGYTVLVRDLDLPRARGALDGFSAEGIDWAWPRVASEVPAATISDNAMLERSAGPRSSGVGVALLRLALAGAAVAVVLAMLRG